MHGSIAHHEGDYESKDGCDHLKGFSVFNVTETEVGTEEAKDKKAKVVGVKAEPFVEAVLIAPEGVADSCYK